MPDWFGWWRRLRAGPDIPDLLWQPVWRSLPFLAEHAPDAALQSRLRALATGFLRRKQFSGAHGLVVTDAMALSIAMQAVLPLLHLAPAQRPAMALAWYDDFVGIVVHPATAVAPRTAQDAAGVVHHYTEELAGEAMERGPVMLSWHDVQARSNAHSTGDAPGMAGNIVIHEFIHKMDMRDGHVDACPPLPAGFLGEPTAVGAKRAWFGHLNTAYETFREQVIRAERFGGDPPWLDAYGASAPEEFFPVACEAYFTQRVRFGQEWPQLLHLFDAFFRPDGFGTGLPTA